MESIYKFWNLGKNQVGCPCYLPFPGQVICPPYNPNLKYIFQVWMPHIWKKRRKKSRFKNSVGTIYYFPYSESRVSISITFKKNVVALYCHRWDKNQTIQTIPKSLPTNNLFHFRQCLYLLSPSKNNDQPNYVSSYFIRRFWNIWKYMKIYEIYEIYVNWLVLRLNSG